jgi:alkylhydroperoxidase/carboxymuconolactone decarboxylase family protein YurZ
MDRMNDTAQALREKLERLAASRGFLLPHHGALAAGAPDLHDAYLRMYNELTVATRVLTAHERESVWLGILIAVEEHVGTHHLELFLEAGGTNAEAEALIALTGQAASLSAFRFAAKSFPDHLHALDPALAYDRCVAALCGPLSERTAHLTLLAVQAARGDRPAIAHHLRAGYAMGLDEDAMVEALSYLIWPRGVNCFLEACEVWHEVMIAGDVAPSERFAVWRDMLGLGAFRKGDGTRVAGFDEGAD